MFWCGAFGLPLVVVVLSVWSGAGCSWLVRALLVWTWVLGVLSRWLVDPCGVVVLTVLCGLLSPFRVLCCCPCPWARAHDWLRVGFLATWGRVLGGLRGCSTRAVGGVELLAEGCWPIRGVFECGCDRVGVRDFGVLRSANGGVTGAGCPLEERASRAGAFSGSRWYPYKGVAILGRQRGCGVSCGLAVRRVLCWPLSFCQAGV